MGKSHIWSRLIGDRGAPVDFPVPQAGLHVSITITRHDNPNRIQARKLQKVQNDSILESIGLKFVSPPGRCPAALDTEAGLADSHLAK